MNTYLLLNEEPCHEDVFLTSTVDGGENSQFHSLAALPAGEITPSYPLDRPQR